MTLRTHPISRRPRIKPRKQKFTNVIRRKRLATAAAKKQQEDERRRRENLVKRALMRAFVKARSRLNPTRVNLTQSNFNKKTFTVRSFLNKNNTNGVNVNINVNVPKRIAFPNNHLMVNENTLPTQSWINDQVRYIQNLDEYDFETAMAFTSQSFKWITPYIYGTMSLNRLEIPVQRDPIFIVPLYPQIKKILSRKNQSTLSNIERIILGSYDQYRAYANMRYIPKDLLKEALDMYIVDLKRIIRNAPPTPRTMVLFRGLDKNIFGVREGLMPGVRHTLKAFTSASYIPNRGYGEHRYVKYILPRGARVLLIQTMNHWANINGRYTGEYEVLMNIGTKFVIQKREIRRPVINNKRRIQVKYVTEVKVYDWPAPPR